MRITRLLQEWAGLILRPMSRGPIPFLANKGRIVPLVIAVIGLMIMSFGCRYAPPHPPTFADFRRLGPGMLEDEKKLNAQVAVFEAAKFLPREIEAIRAKGDTHELIGAALQSRVGDENIPALLREASWRGSNDAVVLTGVARILVRDIVNQVNGTNGAPELVQVLAALEGLEPDNGLPLCIRAYVQMQQGDTNAARRSLIAASQKPALKLHGSELRRCVVQAALAVKYPRYTASMLAIGTLGFSTEIAIVGKRLLADPQLDRTTAEACLELGRRHEAQSNLFIDQLIAFSLQKRALEFLKPPGFEGELKRMKEARDTINRAVAFLDSPKAHTSSEREGLAYFESLFEKSEYEAFEELAKKLNYKP